jgi:plastocyanin
VTSTVESNQIAYVEGFLGIVQEAATSGDYTALDISLQEFQFTVPAGLSVSKGDTVYITTNDLTGHVPDDTGYSTSSGANKIRLFRATSNKDANNMVTGILLGGLNLS